MIKNIPLRFLLIGAASFYFDINMGFQRDNCHFGGFGQRPIKIIAERYHKNRNACGFYFPQAFQIGCQFPCTTRQKSPSMTASDNKLIPNQRFRFPLQTALFSAGKISLAKITASRPKIRLLMSEMRSCTESGQP